MPLTEPEYEARRLLELAAEAESPVYFRMSRQDKTFRLQRLARDWPHNQLSYHERELVHIIRWIKEDYTLEQIRAELDELYEKEKAEHRQQNTAAIGEQTPEAKTRAENTAALLRLIASPPSNHSSQNSTPDDQTT